MKNLVKTNYNIDELDKLVKEIFGELAWFDENGLFEDNEDYEEEFPNGKYEEERRHYEDILCVYTDEKELEDFQIGCIYIGKNGKLSYDKFTDLG